MAGGLGCKMLFAVHQKELVGVVRIFPGRLSGGFPTDRRSQTHCKDYISLLAWERPGMCLEELEGVAGLKGCWVA